MNRLYDSAKAGQEAARGPLDLVGCQNCGFVWNASFEPDLIRYDGDYENDQTHSPAFAQHFRERAQDIAASRPQMEDLSYLEIGCGQGRFIEEVASVAGARLSSAEGFDPAWRGEDGTGPAGARIHTCYFDSATAGRQVRQPNVVASRHTIEHVPDPVAFLRTIASALGADSKATLFIETPCVEWILRNEAMQDFFYEHCSLFTAGSLTHALQASGFCNVEVQHVFGGQYLWARAEASGTAAPVPSLTAETRIGLEGVRSQFLKRWRTHVLKRAEQGKIAIWGAGAKGVAFALMLDPEARIFDHVIDINPAKQNKHVPGNGLQVLSPAEAAQREPKTIYVMNPVYLPEIQDTVKQVGIAADLVSIN